MTVGLVLETCVSQLKDTHTHIELLNRHYTKPGSGGTLRKRGVSERRALTNPEPKASIWPGWRWPKATSETRILERATLKRM